jgi:hypothetical protein
VVTATEPTFLYPHSRQFPFDEVCEQIVRALEERNWNVPGISVEFDVYGTGDEKYRMVRHIKGQNFKLWFCRVQGNMGHYNDTAAVTRSSFPARSSTSTTTSGPTFRVYVGKNWPKDQERWFTSTASSTASRAGTCSTPEAAFGPSGDATHTHRAAQCDAGAHERSRTRVRPEGPKQYYTKTVFLEFTKCNVLA